VQEAPEGRGARRQDRHLVLLALSRLWAEGRTAVDAANSGVWREDFRHETQHGIFFGGRRHLLAVDAEGVGVAAARRGHVESGGGGLEGDGKGERAGLAGAIEVLREVDFLGLGGDFLDGAGDDGRAGGWGDGSGIRVERRSRIGCLTGWVRIAVDSARLKQMETNLAEYHSPGR